LTILFGKRDIFIIRSALIEIQSQHKEALEQRISQIRFSLESLKSSECSSTFKSPKLGLLLSDLKKVASHSDAFASGRGADRVLKNVKKTMTIIEFVQKAKEDLKKIEDSGISTDSKIEEAVTVVEKFRAMESQGALDLLDSYLVSQFRLIEQQTIKQVKSQFEQAIGKKDSSLTMKYAKLLVR
jgi:hypothetical protein